MDLNLFRSFAFALVLVVVIAEDLSLPMFIANFLFVGAFQDEKSFVICAALQSPYALPTFPSIFKVLMNSVSSGTM